MKLVFRDQGFTNDAQVLEAASLATILVSVVVHRRAALDRLLLADRFPKKWVMFSTYFITAATIPLLLQVRPGIGFLSLRLRHSVRLRQWAQTT